MILPQLVTVHDHEPDPAFEEVARAADAVYIEVLLHQLVSSAVKESRSCCVGSLPCVSSLENDIMSLRELVAPMVRDVSAGQGQVSGVAHPTPLGAESGVCAAQCVSLAFNERFPRTVCWRGACSRTDP